jgi:type I restriction enzyme S subunit
VVPHFDLLALATNGTHQLRSLLVSLAVRGRLVPQCPNDEPASALVSRIRAERCGLKAAPAVHKLAEEPGEDLALKLPRGWQQVRLGEIFSLEYGSALPEKNREPGAFPVYGSNGVVGTHSQALVGVPSLVIGRKGSVGAVNIAEGPFWPIDTS